MKSPRKSLSGASQHGAGKRESTLYTDHFYKSRDKQGKGATYGTLSRQCRAREARGSTDKAHKYANRLCKHFTHEVRAEWTPPEGIAEFPGLGTCRMRSSPDELVLTVKARDAQTLARVEQIVGSHLEQFGKRDGLKIGWGRQERL